MKANPCDRPPRRRPDYLGDIVLFIIFSVALVFFGLLLWTIFVR